MASTMLNKATFGRIAGLAPTTGARRVRSAFTVRAEKVQVRDRAEGKRKRGGLGTAMSPVRWSRTARSCKPFP
jgi:hypothetical protein